MSDWLATATCPDCHATIAIPITATRGHIADQYGHPVTSLRLTTSIGPHVCHQPDQTPGE